MTDLKQLVHEALDRLREERTGCFVHNAGAAELLEYGTDAIAAIENEVLALAEPGRRPRDLVSVMVIYSQLLRKFEVGNRAVTFLRRLPQSFREDAIGGACGAWHLHFPTPCTLPGSIRDYLEELRQNGTELERRTATKILQRDDKFA